MKIKYSKDALKFLTKVEKKLSEQTLAVEFIKRMILAWDPDYAKLTEQERIRMEQAEESGFIDEEDINWDNLEQYL